MKRFCLVLIWPIVVLAGVLLFAQFKSGYIGAEVSHFRLKILGHDPKDLLRGRYLLFTVDWNFESYNTPSAFDNYLCFKKNPLSPYPIVKWIPEPAPECVALVDKDSVLELNRFYLPEFDAPVVERIFQQQNHLYEIEVNVARGSITPTSLLIDGKTWQSSLEKYKSLNK